jgi:enoyl-CoA hydratase/carnithine racemase
MAAGEGEEIDVNDDPVLLEVTGGVAVITLNRPDQHNAMGDAADALFSRYLELLRTDRDVRVVVWRGKGLSFSTGRDLAELVGEVDPPTGNGHKGGPVNGNGKAAGGDGKAAGGTNGATHGTGVGLAYAKRHAARRGAGVGDLQVLERSHWCTRLLQDFPVPVICALKGWALGTAFERALMCDVRVAGQGARLGLSAMDHGLIPESAGVAKLFEIGGSSLALDLALTTRCVGASEALRLGLVSRVVPDDELDDVVLDMARSIAERPPLAVRLVREHVQSLAAAGVRSTLGRELVGQSLVLASHDFREQRQAQAEDREPHYERR